MGATCIRNSPSSQWRLEHPMVGLATVPRPDSSEKEVQCVLRWRRTADRPRDHCACDRLDLGWDHSDHPWSVRRRLRLLQQPSRFVRGAIPSLPDGYYEVVVGFYFSSRVGVLGAPYESGPRFAQPTMTCGAVVA